jgi:hypothetical protein
VNRIRIILGAVALITSSIPAGAQSDYAAKSAWQFNNFKCCPPMPPPDPTFSWELYRDSFIGIPPTEDPVSSAFDVLFYQQIYKDKLAKDGNCYGMSLLSLMILKNGGHLGYCAPVSQYSGDIFGQTGPTDPMLMRAINIMHGHQVNLPTLQYMLDIIASHANRDGAFAYTRFTDLKLRQDLTLISITKSLNPNDGGHTLVAYDAQDLGGGNKRIFVYDPNRTWADPASRTWYQTGQNYVQISGSSWSFDLGTTGTWSGSPASGGNIIITPISITGPHSRTPASLGGAIIGKILNTLLLSGQSARIEQVTDANGKRLFKPGTFEVETDPSIGMKNMLPFFPSDQTRAGDNGGLILFQLGSSGGLLKVQVTGSESGYTLRSIGAQSQVIVTARGGRGTDVISLHQIGSSEPRIRIENRRGTSEYDVRFIQATRPRELLHVLSSTRVRVPADAQVEFGVSDRDRALSIYSSSATLQFDLELKTVTREGEKSLARKGVALAPRTQQIVQPQNWLKLQDTEVIELLRPYR